MFSLIALIIKFYESAIENKLSFISVLVMSEIINKELGTDFTVFSVVITAK